MSDQNDISMLDVSNALDSISNESQQPPQRRKSTLILTDEPDSEQMHVESPKPAETPDSHGSSSEPGVTHAAPAPVPPVAAQPVPEQEINVPVDITWSQGGDKVYVTGSFTGWRKMIGLQKQADNTHVVTLGLPVGTHRFRFVIDNELRFSDFLPTATDQMGNFVNYVEVTPEHVQMHLRQQSKFEEEQQQQREQEARKMSQKTAQNSQNSQNSSRNRSLQGRPRSDSIFKFISDDDDMGNGYSRYYDDDDVESSTDSRSLNYINDIPPIFVEPKVMEQYYMAIDDQAKSQNGPQQAWLHPPQLPPQLDNVILNNFNSMDRHNNSGALPIPNHVVLNHLATTSIKHNTLAVASVVRYKRKYVTQVLYAPLQGSS